LSSYRERLKQKTKKPFSNLFFLFFIFIFTFRGFDLRFELIEHRHDKDTNKKKKNLFSERKKPCLCLSNQTNFSPVGKSMGNQLEIYVEEIIKS
jgi:hypothetical protein